MEGKLKILGTNKKSEENVRISLTFCVFWDFFIVMSLSGNVHVWLGCTKMRCPEIDTVLHWRPPDIHMFHTDPSLLYEQ